MSDTLVIIPTYNEEKAIVGVVGSIKCLYPDIDIAVVNDGSCDRTAQEAEKAGAVVISHPFNMGYGVALQTGYKYALRKGYNYVVQLDGDGQHDTADIGTVLSVIMTGSVDIVLGSRFLNENNYRPSFLRLAGIRLFRFLIRLFSGRIITDPTTGFQAMNKNVLSIFVQDVFPVDYPDADVIVMLSNMGFRICEASVVMHPNKEGKSMHSNPLKVLYYVFKMVLALFLTKTRKYSISNIN